MTEKPLNFGMSEGEILEGFNEIFEEAMVRARRAYTELGMDEDRSGVIEAATLDCVMKLMEQNNLRITEQVIAFLKQDSQNETPAL